ncbi:MAG: phosphotransferase [Acidimicrobiales bacterium]
MAVIPLSADEVSPAWLASVLGVPVESCSVADLGEGAGVLAKVLRVDVVHNGPAELPTAFVLKLVSPYEVQREVSRTYGFYEREVRFYRDLAGSLPVRVPAAYHAEVAPSGEPFALLIELVADARIPDQVVGVAIADAERTVDALAGLHARFWNAPALGVLDWVPAMNVPHYRAAGDHIGMVLPMFRDAFDGRVPSAVVAAMERLQPRWADYLDDRVAATADRTTVIHYDPRADNLLFDSDDRLCLIDWQMMARYAGAFDVAYACAQNLTVEDRRAHEGHLLRRYHGRLVDAGIDVGLGAIEDDYRASMLQLCAGMVVAASFDPGNERGRSLLDAMTIRSFTAADDLGAGEFADGR